MNMVIDRRETHRFVVEIGTIARMIDKLVKPNLSPRQRHLAPNKPVANLLLFEMLSQPFKIAHEIDAVFRFDF